ncbi:MAG: hypothetical protein QUS11_06740 [Candidatus Fermentibacter sp.]|nr:hypothetical protein [Candidatus Fermentibacter sp.]
MSRSPGIESVAWAALAAVFLLRVAVLLFQGAPGSEAWEGRISYTDTHSYLHAAEELSDGSQAEPLFRTPGYPILLNATADLAGPRWTCTMILQQIAELATALAVAAMAAQTLGRQLGAVSGALYMCLPSGIIYSSYMIPDVHVSMLTALSGLLWLRIHRGGTIPGAAVAGLGGGLCMAAGLMLKPVVLYSPVIYAALTAVPGPGRARRAVFAAALAVPLAASYLLLRTHNENSFGLPGMTTQDALEPMGRMVQIADYRGLGVGGGTFWMYRDSLEALCTVDGVMDYAMRDSVFRAAARDAVLSNPLRVAWFELSRWPKFFVNLDAHRPYLGLTPPDRKPLLYAGLTTILQFPLLIALVSALPSRRVRAELGGIFWLGLAWFLYSVPVIGPIASFRYGLMFYWALVPFVPAAASVLLRRRRQREDIPVAQSTGRKVSP